MVTKCEGPWLHCPPCKSTFPSLSLIIHNEEISGAAREVLADMTLCSSQLYTSVASWQVADTGESFCSYKCVDWAWITVHCCDWLYTRPQSCLRLSLIPPPVLSGQAGGHLEPGCHHLIWTNCWQLFIFLSHSWETTANWRPAALTCCS